MIVLACSSTYDTDPVGEILDQPSFLNACARIETALAPEELLDACKAIERELGRDLESGVRHAPRPIDVDLLLLGDEPYASERLTLPHAQATSGRFVLIPLLELDFDLRDARRHAAERLPGRHAARRGRAPRGAAAAPAGVRRATRIGGRARRRPRRARRPGRRPCAT